jgi:hypothetical protein
LGEPDLEPVLQPVAPITSKTIKFTSGTLDDFVNYRDYELSAKEVSALPKQKEEKEEMVLFVEDDVEVEDDDNYL